MDNRIQTVSVGLPTLQTLSVKERRRFETAETIYLDAFGGHCPSPVATDADVGFKPPLLVKKNAAKGNSLCRIS
jgi:hypothetical protein